MSDHEGGEDPSMDVETTEDPLRPGSYSLTEATPASASAADVESTPNTESQSGPKPTPQHVAQSSAESAHAFRREIHDELKRSGAFERIRAMVLQHAKTEAQIRCVLFWRIGGLLSQSMGADASVCVTHPRQSDRFAIFFVFMCWDCSRFHAKPKRFGM